MRFAPILFLASGITAFLVPEGAIDGTYEVDYNEVGEEVHTLINSAAAVGPFEATSTDVALSAKFKRQSGTNPGVNSITCGTKHLDSKSTDDANNNLDAQCGNGAFVGNGKTYYAKFGSTVAFYCNYKGGNNQCFANERQDASRRITESCGRYVAGYDHIPARSNTYGYQDVGVCFCFC